MRYLLNLVMILSLMIASWVSWGVTHPATAQGLSSPYLNPTPIFAEDIRNPVDEKLGEVGRKIDLNNSSVVTFVHYRGLYPHLARKIIENAPFDKVEDVLKMPGLSSQELEILKANLDNFVVTPPIPALTEGGDRINPGIYK
jgi:photosystem II PsbU protein